MNHRVGFNNHSKKSSLFYHLSSTFYHLPSAFYLLPVILTLLITSCLITQQAKTGDMLFQEKKYTEAADLLKTEYNKEADPVIRAKKAYTIGECYRYSANTVEAEQWYKIAAETGDDSRAKYMYALMLKTNEKYEEAVKAFNAYLKESPFDEEAKSEVEACTSAMQWKKADSKFTVAGVDAINSDAYDYAPVFYGKNGIVFTSDRADATGSETYGWTGKDYTDLYVTYKDGSGKFGAPVLFNEKINSDFNDADACFSKDFTECYFTRCGSALTKDDYCAIFYSYKNGDEWSDPQQLTIFHDSCNVSQPFLSPDGKELYVSSDVDGGYGGKDLYVLTKDIDGNWSNPQNLGSNVNTPGDERFPELIEGKLYFASDGQEGMGGLDIFSATKINKQWNNVQNLRSPINSGADDFALLFEKVQPEEHYRVKSQGYFVSNRPGGKGKDDIYYFVEERTKVFLVKGSVAEKQFSIAGNPNSNVVGFNSMPSIDVTISMLDETGNPVAGTQHTVKSDPKGRFTFLVESDRNYKVSASKPEYFTKSETASTNNFKMEDKDTVIATVQLVLDKIYKNVQVNISNIYYDYNKANIRTDAAKVLDTLVIVLKENPNVKVEIGSHTDSRGNDAYNMKLSQARAQSVVDYLAEHGIDKTLLTAKGYGESQPVNKCKNGVNCTEEEFQANRRTTFKVTAATFTIESSVPETIEVDSSMLKK